MSKMRAAQVAPESSDPRQYAGAQFFVSCQGGLHQTRGTAPRNRGRDLARLREVAQCKSRWLSCRGPISVWNVRAPYFRQGSGANFRNSDCQGSGFGGGIAVGNGSPVHGVPPSLEVVRTAVLVVEIIGVFPNVVAE